MFKVQVSKKTAASTSSLWEAIGGQPLELVLSKLQAEGWVQQSATEGALRNIVMARDNKHATLYIANGKVGMVQVQ